MNDAVVKAVCRSDKRSLPKLDIGRGELRAAWGVVGDSHAGPPRPGRWQISLLAWEDVERLNREQGLSARPGSFAENLSTEGLHTKRLQPGDQLRLGEEVLLQVEQVGKPAAIAHTYNYQGHSLLPALGVFCRVVEGGPVVAGDKIVVVREA